MLRFLAPIASLAILCFVSCVQLALGTEYFVSPLGSDDHPGTAEQPLQTIQAAANIMQAGDTCTVRAGEYREWVKPPRGGTSETSRIVYRAAKGERVVIKGSERIQFWNQVRDGLWKAVLQDSFFGNYNPFKTQLAGEFITYGTEYHMGDIYLNGMSFKEKFDVESVEQSPHSFFAASAPGETHIYANFGSAHPNSELVEVNVRECVFFPRRKGLGYITVDGFIMRHAAANWVCFRAFQHALIDTYYGKHWVIQNNLITDARCAGLVCGNDPSHQDEGFDIRETGRHLVRNNVIRRCGEAGIHGFKGWAGSIIENNLIEDINAKDEFGGWETAGIKIHDGVDFTFRNNIVRRVHTSKKRGEFAAVWIDWGGQGVRVSGNVIYDCSAWSLYLQNNHGPILVDNNIISGPIVQASDNCVFAHNLFADCWMRYDVTNSQFKVVYYQPHTATPVAIAPKSYINDYYFNNVFFTRGADQIPAHTNYQCDYNMFYAGANKSEWGDVHSTVSARVSKPVSFETHDDRVTVTWRTDGQLGEMRCPMIDHALVGKLGLPKQDIEDRDGKLIVVDRDVISQQREPKHNVPGPLFEQRDHSSITLTVLGAGRIPSAELP